jgi:hypothetical protein
MGLLDDQDLRVWQSEHRNDSLALLTNFELLKPAVEGIDLDSVSKDDNGDSTCKKINAMRPA